MEVSRYLRAYARATPVVGEITMDMVSFFPDPFAGTSAVALSVQV